MTVPYSISDPELVSLAEQMMWDEITSCTLCSNGFAPPHFRSYIRYIDESKTATILINNPCQSSSRVFDPTIPGFVGHSHCTCDTCF